MIRRERERYAVREEKRERYMQKEGKREIYAVRGGKRAREIQRKRKTCCENYSILLWIQITLFC